MTEAEIAVDAYHARKAKWPSAKFKPARRVVSERSDVAPEVRFYRYPDGSVARLETDGDMQAF